VTPPEPSLLPVDGPAAPPRSNGELVFAEPWESRAFGLAFALYDRGHFTWEDFQQALIEAVANWERQDPVAEDWNYYRCWLAALERLVDERDLVACSEVDGRAVDLHHRAPGHDH
jgi:nitrile hydratase accessory protein